MELLPTRCLGVGNSLERGLNRLFEDFAAMGEFGWGRGGWQPVLDIAETEDELLISAEVPGIEISDLDISLTGNVLTISGEKKSESEENGTNFHLVERRHGEFRRSLTLPNSVDPEKITAKCRDGVLTIQLGKREETKPRSIEVRV